MPADPFILVPYSPQWPADFRQLAALLRSTLGTAALRIDHIGSTAVPNLCSKDVIDIQVTLAGFEDPAPLDAFTRAGFICRPQIHHDHIPPGHNSPPSDWEKRYFREPPAMRPAHIHIRPAGKPNQRYALLLRDYLRAHPPAAAAYARIKQRLAPKLERLDYIEAKDPVCDLIIQAAEVWARSHWTPGPSDA